EEVGKELRVQPPAREGLSGTFEIAAAQRLELSGTVLSAAGVRGRIACAEPDAPVRVGLYRVTVGGGHTSKRGVRFDEEEPKQVGGDGEFEFTDLRPAVWMVRAWWTERSRDLYFTGRTFQLTPGSDLDLGLLHPLTGDELEVTLGIVDEKGRRL